MRFAWHIINSLYISQLGNPLLKVENLKGYFRIFAMVECLYKKLRIRIYFRAKATKATSNKFSRNNSVTIEQKNAMQVNTTFTIIYIYIYTENELIKFV